MTKYCTDMCIVCFAPKRYDSSYLYSTEAENLEPLLSEVGMIYQDLIQVSLIQEEPRPRFVCSYCKNQLVMFHKFKMKALESYKKVSDEIYNNISGTSEESNTDNCVRIEEITVFDVATKQTEKFEIQYLDEGDNNTVQYEGVTNAQSINNSEGEQIINDTNSQGVYCQLCCKTFTSKEVFNIHWKEHEELPQYSPEVNYRSSSGAEVSAQEYELGPYDHLPVYACEKSGTCEHFSCTRSQTRWLCAKCQVHLCLQRDKNCFYYYHAAKSQEEYEAEQSRKNCSEEYPASEIIHETFCVPDDPTDRIGHIPLHLEKPKRCRKKGCEYSRSRWMCAKCQLPLCLYKGKNCFYEYHVENRPQVLEEVCEEDVWP